MDDFVWMDLFGIFGTLGGFVIGHLIAVWWRDHG